MTPQHKNKSAIGCQTNGIFLGLDGMVIQVYNVHLFLKEWTKREQQGT